MRKVVLRMNEQKKYDIFKKKNQLKTIPYIVIGMILRESVVSSDFAKNSRCYRNVKITTHKIF